MGTSREGRFYQTMTDIGHWDIQYFDLVYWRTLIFEIVPRKKDAIFNTMATDVWQLKETGQGTAQAAMALTRFPRILRHEVCRWIKSWLDQNMCAEKERRRRVQSLHLKWRHTGVMIFQTTDNATVCFTSRNIIVPHRTHCGGCIGDRHLQTQW